ncbi:hypothetical protein BDV25DRAFT_129159 [Aspergillus avenaceus]|uniref:chitinase n=1 Tax=Aspergillus avenaceus TaxID=36643 RepID=A0A5N6TX72_ASPAV|nr:hypothetical protein BDV25DRAFT_129159 [Aspergillus avenaceus]
MLPTIALALLAGLGFLPSVLAADTYYYCSDDKCINSCHNKAECNPGGWDDKYVNATSCPLNVCCSSFGFCGTTEEFCGNKTSLTRVIGYYNSAAATRSCGGMSPQSIPQGVYSHIYFAFVSIDPDTFEVIPASQDDELLYPQLEALQARDLGQELWLSIGGWDFSDAGQPTATTFSDLVGASKSKQNAFFKSLTNFMTTWGFTGIDIDWEYPAADDRNGRAADYKNFPKFMANLKKALKEYRFGLSVTLPTSYWYLQHFDLESLDSSVDWFNFMSYDLHGTWDMGNKWTGAYLDAHTNLTEIKTALDLLWRNDIKPSKVNMGMAFYGRSVTLASSSCTEPGCTYLSAGNKAACSNTAGVLFNNEIQQIIDDKDITPTLYKDAAVKTITWNTDQWVSYDDEDTWKLKAEFAKSECLGGVLVWSIDNDDNNHTFSNGLAAALGNKINLNTTSGLSDSSFGRKSTDSSNDEGQEQYCRFVNCGEVCTSGWTEVTRADKKKNLMLDSTTCPPGMKQTQTLCCPTSTDVPTCRWRGFHNNGKCKGGCNDDEVEIGTVGKGCKSGYQSACCTKTKSVEPWSKCQWTSDCKSDKTCPSGYPNFVVGSRDGWGGRKSCSGKKNYNYCCSGDSVPDAFQECEWKGHGIKFTNENWCSTHCPAGSIRIAEQVINTMWNNDKTAHTSDCYYGNEAYCCSGKKKTVSPRSDPPDVYKDQTARELDAYLTKFLENPICPAGWDSQYSASFSLATRDLDARKNVISDEGVVLTFLLPIMAVWVTSQYTRQDLTDIITSRLTQHGLQDEAGNITTLRSTLYGSVDSWTGLPIWDPTPVLAGYLCNIAESRHGLLSMQAATDVLCAEDDTDESSLAARRVTVIGQDGDRSANGVEPTITLAINGVLNGDLSLHYLRWINAQGSQVLLEMAFWIGGEPGVEPSSDLRQRYADRSHTAATDRWIVFHLHINLDRHTFRSGEQHWYPGVTTMGIYHSQDTTTVRRVTHGYQVDRRAQFRYTSTYNSGNDNTGTMRNYNTRTEALTCQIGGNRRWYVGYSREAEIARLERQGTRRPSGYATLLNRFGQWMWDEGIFSVENLQYIWPNIAEDPDGFGVPVGWNANDEFNPVAGAFDSNWMPDEDGHNTSVLDTDGSVLYEGPYGGLLSEIVKRNDVATLQQYIQKNPGLALAYYGSYGEDAFLLAAWHGHIDALRLLLEEYRTNANAETQPLDDRRFVLLHEACRCGQVELVRFLLDSEPPLGTLHAQHPGGETALLAAADFFATLGSDHHDIRSCVDDCLARGEKLMYLLLDRGASVHDSIRSTDDCDPPPQPLYTVLSRTAARGSYNLLKRLINEGADVHARVEHFDDSVGCAVFQRSRTLPRDVTALHYASIYWNAEGVKALLDHRGNVDIAEMVSVRDGIGRLPLHWAAAGDGFDSVIPEKEIVPRIMNIFNLLLTGNPDTINIQDNEQLTALHYAVASHAPSGRHLHDQIKYLCENGADAGLQDSRGQTVLHVLASVSFYSGPIDTALIDLLVAHGADIKHADKDGTTALHIMARSLRQVKAAEFLISRGADVHARDSKGNTPLHEVAGRGILPTLPRRDGDSGPVTLDDRINAQNQMIEMLLKSGENGLMDQPNAADRTPRQLLEEKRESWQRIDRKPAGRGRGRG